MIAPSFFHPILSSVIQLPLILAASGASVRVLKLATSGDAAKLEEEIDGARL